MSRIRKIMYSMGGSSVTPPDYGSVGFLLARYRTDLPTSPTFLEGHNTLITNDYSQQEIAMEFDLSGRGKHQYYQRNYGPIYDPVTKTATMNGNQLAEPVNLDFRASTFGLLTSVPVDGNTFMTVGSINESITWLGDVTGGLTGEKYTVFTNNAPQDYMATGNAANAGWNLIGHTLCQPEDGTAADSGIYYNGQAQNLITGQKLTTILGTTVRFASNGTGTGVRFAGTYKERFYYATPADPTGWATLNSLVQR